MRRNGNGWMRVAAVGLMLGASGCSSTTAKYIDPQRLEHGRHVGGVPVVVARDQWIKFTHKRVRLEVFKKESQNVNAPAAQGAGASGQNNGFEVQGGTSAVRTATAVRITDNLQIPASMLVQDKWEQEIISVGEMYALDIVRPFAGTSDHSVKFKDDKGHLESVGMKTDDKTLETTLSHLKDIGQFMGISADKIRDDAARLAGVPVAEIEVVEVPEAVLGVYIYNIEDLKCGRAEPVLVLPFPGNSPCTPPCGRPSTPPCPTCVGGAVR